MSTTRICHTLTANDLDRLIELWQAAGLHYKSHGRDSHKAFEKQLAGGTQFAIGIDSEDGQGRRWSTVGVSANIVDASFEALLDAIQWKLIRDFGAPS